MPRSPSALGVALSSPWRPWAFALAGIATGVLATAAGLLLWLSACVTYGHVPGCEATGPVVARFLAGLLLGLVGVLALWGFVTLVGDAHFARREGLVAAGTALVVADDVVTQITNAIISFFSTIWNGIVSFANTIFTSIANVLAEVFQAPVTAIEASWATFTTWSQQFAGPFAPILVTLMLGAVLAVIGFFIWLLIKFSVSEGEETVEEVEEGE